MENDKKYNFLLRLVKKYGKINKKEGKRDEKETNSRGISAPLPLTVAGRCLHLPALPTRKLTNRHRKEESNVKKSKKANIVFIDVGIVARLLLIPGDCVG